MSQMLCKLSHIEVLLIESLQQSYFLEGMRITDYSHPNVLETAYRHGLAWLWFPVGGK